MTGDKDLFEIIRKVFNTLSWNTAEDRYRWKHLAHGLRD